MAPVIGSGLPRRSKRKPVKPEVFCFSLDHKPAAARIKQCRERQRINIAVKKCRTTKQKASENVAVEIQEAVEKEVDDNQPPGGGKVALKTAQVYIIHDVPVFYPRWVFQVPFFTPKFGS